MSMKFHAIWGIRRAKIPGSALRRRGSTTDRITKLGYKHHWERQYAVMLILWIDVQSLDIFAQDSHDLHTVLHH